MSIFQYLLKIAKHWEVWMLPVWLWTAQENYLLQNTMCMSRKDNTSSVWRIKIIIIRYLWQHDEGVLPAYQHLLGAEAHGRQIHDTSLTQAILRCSLTLWLTRAWALPKEAKIIRIFPTAGMPVTISPTQLNVFCLWKIQIFLNKQISE